MRRQLYGYEGHSFAAYFWFVGWWAISFGFHVSFRDPNIEIHLPFGFFRIGCIKHFEAALSQEHAPGRKESQP